jgi:hypothetical protein
MRGYAPTPVDIRIQRNSEITASGCWMWKLSVNHHGYGFIQYAGKLRQAHRVSYETFVGPIPEGMVIDHLCGMPGCVNPQHLEAVSQYTNVLRGCRATKPYCVKGHLLPVKRNARGHRVCQQCKNKQWRESRAAKRLEKQA